MDKQRTNTLVMAGIGFGVWTGHQAIISSTLGSSPADIISAPPGQQETPAWPDTEIELALVK